MLDVFQSHGHSEIDTARVYGGGSSEEYLGQLAWRSRNLTMATKLSPRSGAYTHKRDALKPALLESLRALRTDTVDMWYLHAPDHATPYEETLEAVNALYEAGYFKRFGISNFAAWEVAQICEVCRAREWKAPDVYQGVYNALHRAVEPELFPCLRRYGVAFYAFNPVAGGMLTDRYTREGARGGSEEQIETGSRFDPERTQGKNYRGRYWNETYFDALDVVRPVAKRLGLTTAEAALRWMSHHGGLKREFGDAVIIGASSAAQLEENLVNLEKGPLPEEMVRAFDEGWAIVKGVCKPYFH